MPHHNSQERRKRFSLIGTSCLTVVTLISLSACLEASPSDPPLDNSPAIEAPESTIAMRDPSVPIVNPGSGLPSSGNDFSGTEEEVDCDNAEDLCDSGEWACDDIADYCDIGPDDGSELPEDWDWDR